MRTVLIIKWDYLQENQGKGDAVITPVEGQWDIWNSNFQFLESKSVEKWGILVAGYMRLEQNSIE